MKDSLVVICAINIAVDKGAKKVGLDFHFVKATMRGVCDEEQKGNAKWETVISIKGTAKMHLRGLL